MLTFGMLFILSCFSIYNIYWRKQIMQDDGNAFKPGLIIFLISDYVHEVERVPGQSDKPPAYDTLTLSSPPPKVFFKSELSFKFLSVRICRENITSDNKKLSSLSANIKKNLPLSEIKDNNHSYKKTHKHCNRLTRVCLQITIVVLVIFRRF